MRKKFSDKKSEVRGRFWIGWLMYMQDSDVIGLFSRQCGT